MRFLNVLKLTLGSTLAVGAAAYAQNAPGNPHGNPSNPMNAPSGHEVRENPGEADAPGDKPSGMNAPAGQEKTMGGKVSLGPTDQEFISKAVPSGMAEVKLGKLAEDKASSPKVKELARKIVRDHGKANDELKKIADKQGITLPMELTADEKADYDRLSKLSGADFDHAFLEAVSKSHDDAIQLYQRQSEEGQDPQLRSFAKKTLPTLKSHQEMAHRDMRNM